MEVQLSPWQLTVDGNWQATAQLDKAINDIVGDHDNYRVEITLKDYVQ